MSKRARTGLLSFVFLAIATVAFGQSVTIEAPDLALTNLPFSVTVRADDQPLTAADADSFILRVAGAAQPMTLSDGALIANDVTVTSGGRVAIELERAGATLQQAATRAIPGWISIIPPLLAIAMALIFRNVIPALFLGLWVGAWAAQGLSLGGAWRGLLDTLQIYVLGALADADHAAVILFSLVMGGMVGIISKNGGMQGVVNLIIPWARSARRGQVATGVLGLAIFFDDYANALVVGNTMRKVTDRLRISREKLSYIVDSTAAPVACIAFVTTWIGYEVGLIGDAVGQISGFNEAPYSVFLSSIPFSFYPILAIFFVFLVAYSRRDFGPMYHAEVRARTTGQVLAPDANVDEAAARGEDLKPKPDQPQRPLNALIPVGVMIVSVLVGLYVTGEGDTLRDIVGSADSYKSLMWASLLGALTAIVLTVAQRILTLHETIDAWYAGLKSMMFAMVILVLAWSLSSITGVLHTAEFLVSILGDTLTPGLVPTLVFLLSAATAFATGSSWGTMGILMPLVLPLTWAVLTANGMADPAHFYIIYSTVACVLAGSVWGDHCSPISDTTILSSMASGADHMDHVRTQLPYAVLVGAVGILLGTLPTSFGFPWWASLMLGVAGLVAAHRFLGREVEASS